MTAYFIRPFLDLLSLGDLKVMPVSTGSSSLYTLKSFLIAQASPFSDSVSNFLNCLLSFRDYSYRIFQAIFWSIITSSPTKSNAVFSRFSAGFLDLLPLTARICDQI